MAHGLRGFLFLVLSCCVGCANLHVKKVPISERACGADGHHHGFRYYLSRPYLVVHDKVVVKEDRQLVKVKLAPAAPAGGGGAPAGAPPALLQFMQGQRKGEVVPLDQLKVESPGNGGLKPVAPAEIAALRKAVEDQAAQPALQQVDYEGVPGAPEKVYEAPRFSTDSRIQVVYLPDLDEQYAIHSKNIFAKTAFRLDFKDGAQLTNVGAKHDSTTVALKLLEALDSAITNAQDVNDSARKLREAREARGTALKADANTQIMSLVTRHYIKPGLYRLNKPWETEPGSTGAAVGQGTGLLAKLGLSIETEVRLEVP